MGLLSKIFSNTRKPEGFFGRMMVSRMNGGGHAKMANWALTSVQINEDDGLTGNNEKWEKMIEGMHTYKPEEIRLHLANAGFRDIDIQLNEATHWLVAKAVKGDRSPLC